VPRVISFIVLLAILLLVGAVFFQVMAQFIVPLFLACVLLVVFQPLHRWILGHLPKHPRISALITTVLILLVVLLPLVWLGWNAYVELHALLAPAQHKAAVATRQAAAKSAATAGQTSENKGAVAAGQASDNKGAAPAEQTVDSKVEGPFSNTLKNTARRLRNEIQHVIPGLAIDDQQVDDMVASASRFAATKVVSGLQTAVGILVGLAILVISLYYFLADGPVMIDAVMELSPLDARYEQELLERFGDVSRAVVVATLLSAVVQGLLAGVGYYFALPHDAPIFLLVALTMVTAMIPFVGAAFTWVCVCVYIYLYGEHVVDGTVVQGDTVTAVVLAIYCTIVVSGIDNVIKPLVLHGQSKLHPLLALLSILGGVQVLGPVGILVGPMLVSFLQALLNMLRKELDSFGGAVGDSSTPLAESLTGAIQMRTGENGGQPAADVAAAKASARPTGKSTADRDNSRRARRTRRKR
jgi:predicted PurR-regulated permease PerM